MIILNMANIGNDLLESFGIFGHVSVKFHIGNVSSVAQGVEGIAVGLSVKILPHNFNELLDACIAYLRGESFELYPDFQTGGYIDVSKYNDGERGGMVRVRAKVEKIDNKTLAITEIPYGVNKAELIKSIADLANEKND